MRGEERSRQSSMNVPDKEEENEEEEEEEEDG